MSSFCSKLAPKPLPTIYKDNYMTLSNSDSLIAYCSVFQPLLTQTADQPIAWPQLSAFRAGQDNLLKFKPSIRMGKKGDLSDFERGMLVPDGLV